ncbi:MAG TPA: hypothetical protein VE568_00625 [Rubrobacter sp.]|nr:hypothetical protein [Rubrobacter sp.]
MRDARGTLRGAARGPLERRSLVPGPGEPRPRLQPRLRGRLRRRGGGQAAGGNLGTLCLLFGTSFMPDLEGSLLVLEDDEEILPVHVDRLLRSLIHQLGFEGVRDLVLGRFQRASEMNPDTIKAIDESKRELAGVPVVANASFGHTTPQFTFPIGGYGRVRAADGAVKLWIDEH